jgi:hypothetical protein
MIVAFGGSGRLMASLVRFKSDKEMVYEAVLDECVSLIKSLENRGR